jgi:hypothetical protein
MSLLKKNNEHYILLLILLVSAAMRLYNYSSWSLSNDELSALYGVSLGDFHKMIDDYVRTDFHPAGVQVFLYYWIKLFGNSEASVRLPFVITGILSVLFSYSIASKWFSRTTGLFVAATIGFLGYTILYSQLARPYSFGLFFSLAAVHCWTNILFGPREKSRWAAAAGWALSLAGCMYTHYFSFLFAIMAGATGLLFIKKHNWLAYLLPPAIAVVLYLPHLPIALEQFGRGGLSTWLGKPEPGYFFKYLFYCFNDSIFLCIIIAVIVLASLLIGLRGWGRFRTIALAWFLLPFLVGYFYSVYVNPVLQYSILIFSFPFLLILLFSFFDPLKKKLNYILLAVLMLAGIFSTVIEKKFYTTQYFGVFKELAQKANEWNKKYGAGNITRTVNVIAPYYINYYAEPTSGNKQTGYYKMYETVSGEQLGRLQRIVDSTNTEYFTHAWSNTWNPYETWEIIKKKYPVVVEDHRFFNSEIALFKKGPERVPVWSSIIDFNSRLLPGEWNAGKTLNYVEELAEGKMYMTLDSLHEFGPTLTTTAAKVFTASDYVVIRARTIVPDGSDAQLVISFEGETKDWASVRLSDFNTPSALLPPKPIIVRKKQPGIKPGDPVKVYIWNPGKDNIYIGEIGVYSYSDSDYSYRN